MFCSLVYTAWIYSGAANCTCCCRWSSSVFFSVGCKSTFTISDSDLVNAALTTSVKAMWPHIISSFCGVEFEPIKMNSRWHKLPKTGLVIYQADICQKVRCQGAETKECAHYSKVWTTQFLFCFPPYIGTLCLGNQIICLNPAERTTPHSPSTFSPVTGFTMPWLWSQQQWCKMITVSSSNPEQAIM